MFCVIIFLCLVSLCAALLFAAKKKKKNISAGQLLTSLATTVISLALLLNSFELVPRGVYMAIVILGCIVEILAFIVIVRQNEF